MGLFTRLLGLAAFLYLAGAQDVVCGKKISKTILVDVGDSFSFKTQTGRKHRPNSRCVVRYKKSPACSYIRFSCSKFSIQNKKSSCTKKGDRMVVVADGKAKRFCQRNPPNITISKDLRVVIHSNKGGQSSGAECLVQCQEATASTAIGHCCKKKIVNFVEYTLLKVSDGDLHLDLKCLNNCVYRGPDSPNTICFAPGNNQHKCIEASDHFEAFQSEAKSVSSDTEALYLAKTKEYSMKKFTSLEDKLAWIKKDVEQMTGQPFPTTSWKSYLKKVPASKRNKFRKLDAKFEKHINNIINLYEDDHEQVNQALDEMEDDMLHQTQNDHELHQVAHHGINAARLALKLLKKDEEGNNALGNMISAILNNTDSKTYRIKQRNWNEVGKEVAKGYATDIVGGAIAGCLITVEVGCVEGAALGAAGGAIVGTVGAVVDIIDEAAGCFSTTSQVETLAGFISLQKLVIGDFIRTSSGGLETHFTEFVGWMDRQESSPVQMLQVWTSENLSPLTLTGSHIVFTQASTKYADELLPGDSLLHWNGTSMQEQNVTQILKSLDFGFGAPLTMDGTLLIDGYLTSCYASFPHQLSDIVMKPVKTFPSILLDNEESQHKDGVRVAIKIIKQIGELLGSRKPKITNGEHFPIVGENIVNSFMDKSEF